MKRALVTGGTGFIGRHLVRRLLTDGWEVHVVSRMPPAVGLAVTHIPAVADPVELASRVAAAQPTTAFHLAAHYPRTHTSADIGLFVQTNIQLGMALIEGLRACGCPRLVNAGTVWQDSGEDRGAVNLYAATKRAFAEILKYSGPSYGLTVVSILLADTYAEDDPRPRFLTALRTAWRRRERINATKGEQVIDLLHATDVADAFVHAAGLELPLGKASSFTVPSGNSLSLRELVACIERVTGERIDIAWGGRPYAPDEVFAPIFAQPALPKWSPRISLAEGLQRFFRNSANS